MNKIFQIYIPIVAVPILATVFAGIEKGPLSTFFGFTLLCLLCIVLPFYHHGELLRYKKAYAVYFIVAGVFAALSINSNRSSFLPLVHFISFSALGTSVLWVPGALRTFSFIIFFPFIRNKPGISEAAVLHFSFIPQHVQLIIDSKKYPLILRKKSFIQKVFGAFNVVQKAFDLVQFCLALVMHLLYISNCLASVSLTRRFSCRLYRPIVSLHPFELLTMYLFIGLTLWISLPI
jgi:hypothetical protein